MINKDDEELVELFKKIKTSLIVILIFSVLLTTIFIKRFNQQDTKITKKIKNQESLYVLLYDNKCSTCSKIKEILKDNNIEYYQINNDKNNDYKKVLSLLKINDEEIISPTMIYIKKGKFSSSTTDIKDKEVLEKFIKYNKNYN